MIEQHENEIQLILEKLVAKIYSCYRLGKISKGELTTYSIKALKEVQEIQGKILNEVTE